MAITWAIIHGQPPMNACGLRFEEPPAGCLIAICEPSSGRPADARASRIASAVQLHRPNWNWSDALRYSSAGKERSSWLKRRKIVWLENGWLSREALDSWAAT